MSLSTQLARGTLALPMLALFGALALFANDPVDAQTLPSPAAIEMSALAQATCNSMPPPVLLPSQAPADLGPIAQRQARNIQLRMASTPACRA